MRPKGAKFDTPVGVRVVVGASGASIHAAFRRPLWCLRHHLAPVGSMSLDSQSPLAPYESSSFATPAKAVGLWTLDNVPHDSAGKRREVYSAP